MVEHAPWNADRAAAIIERHRAQDGATLPILHALQHAFGFVPREAIPMVAAALNLTRAEVHGIASFYHDFRHSPPGRHVLRLCRAEACQAMGADALHDAARRRLGIGWHETTADGAVTPGAGVLPRPLRGRALGNAGWRPARSTRSRRAGCGAGGGAMSRVFVPRDAAALALGAEAVAAGLAAAGAEVVRTGSRGMFWLEPMVEVETAAGRIAYGPVRAADLPGLLAAGMLSGGAHALRLGRAEDIPFFAGQTRFTFARCGVVDPAVARRLPRPWRAEGAGAGAGDRPGR